MCLLFVKQEWSSKHHVDKETWLHEIGSVSLEAVPPKDLQSIVTFCDKLVDIGGAFLETQLLFFNFPLLFYFELCIVVIDLILVCIH